MMRPVSVALPPNAPDQALACDGQRERQQHAVTLTWNDNSLTETSFLVAA